MIELGLSRIAQLIKETPIRWKAIHIAGTNGKGSTAAYISKLLHTQGVRVGRFTSPHLVDRWDCISLNEKPVRKELFKFVENGVKARNLRNKIAATEFELLTATAFEIFNLQGMSVGVVECGVGGRLDATNVLDKSDVLVSVITKIGMDHESLLGDTIEKIAKEKAGIMKSDVPVVIDGTNSKVVKDVLLAHSSEVCSSKFFETSPNTNLAFLEKYGLRRNVAEELLAPHQQSNLILAVSAFEAARRNRNKLQKVDEVEYSPELKLKLDQPDGPQRYRKSEGQDDPIPLVRLEPAPIGKSQSESPQLAWDKKIDLLSVVKSVSSSHKGRLQPISIRPITGRWPPVLLDGAHNAQSAAALLEYVQKHIRRSASQRRLEDRGITWVMAMSKGKPIFEILQTLLEEGDNFVATRFGPVDGMPWVDCEEPESLKAVAESILLPNGYQSETANGRMNSPARSYVGAYEHPWSALGKASQLASRGGPMVITGSLYLVSDVLRMVRDPPKSLGREDQDAWIKEQHAELKRRKRGVFDPDDDFSPEVDGLAHDLKDQSPRSPFLDLYASQDRRLQHPESPDPATELVTHDPTTPSRTRLKPDPDTTWEEAIRMRSALRKPGPLNWRRSSSA